MRALLFLCCAVALSHVAFASRKTYSGHRVIQIETPSEVDAIALEKFLGRHSDLDVWVHPQAGGYAHVLMNDEDMKLFERALDLSHEVFVDDIQERISRSYTTAQSWFEAYHPIEDLNNWLFDVVDQYANVDGVNSRLFDIGQTWENRTIYGIIFGGRNTANPARIVFNGVHHAREWIGPATLHFIIDTFLSSYGQDATITELIDNIEFHIIPVLNADGYSYTWTTDRLWRKTRSTYNAPTIGTDPNRNWDFQWGGDGSSGTPSSGTYRGPFPNSEPEVEQISAYIGSLNNVRGYIDWHSYGQYILSAWGYTPVLPPDTVDQVNLGNRMEQAIRAINNNAYRVGPSGSTLYPTSGSAPDYTYGFNGIKYSYTIELPGNPGGFVLPPEFIIPVGLESVQGTIVFAQQILIEN